MTVRSANPNDIAGFTLIELLIALTLFGLLATVLAGGFRFGMRAWEHEQAHAGGSDDVQHVQTLLRREIEGAYPFLSSGTDLNAHVDFHGKPEDLAFLGPVPETLIQGGRARVSIRAESAPGKLRLILAMQPELATNSEVDREILIDDLHSISFTYYGKENANDPPRWHDRWEGAAILPQLVRLQIIFPEGDARRWPDFVVSPRISVDVACVYDPLTKYCRGR